MDALNASLADSTVDAVVVDTSGGGRLFVDCIFGLILM